MWERAVAADGDSREVGIHPRLKGKALKSLDRPITIPPSGVTDGCANATPGRRQERNGEHSNPAWVDEGAEYP